MQASIRKSGHSKSQPTQVMRGPAKSERGPAAPHTAGEKTLIAREIVATNKINKVLKIVKDYRQGVYRRGNIDKHMGIFT